MDSLDVEFFARCNQRYGQIAAHCCQVVTQIRVLQKIEHQICLDFRWQVLRCVLNQGRQGIIDGDNFEHDTIFAIFPHTGNFALATAVLLEDQYSLRSLRLFHGVCVSSQIINYFKPDQRQSAMPSVQVIFGFRCQVSGVSQAAGKKGGRSNRKRNFEKANIEYRIMNIECRRNVFCLS